MIKFILIACILWLIVSCFFKFLMVVAVTNAQGKTKIKFSLHGVLMDIFALAYVITYYSGGFK